MYTIPIQNLVKDKRVIIVGNSVEMMKYEYGDFIDSFDIVVHLGAAISRGEEYHKNLGSRTDIWSTGTFRLHCYNDVVDEFINGQFKDTMVIFNRVRTKLLDVDSIVSWEKSLPQIPKIDMFNDLEIIKILNDLNYLRGFGNGIEGPANSQRPSGRFMTILYFLKKVKTYKSLDIIGFDFFRKVTNVHRGPADEKNVNKPFSWYLPIRSEKTGITHPHNKNLEFNYIKKLEEDKKLNWNVLSDLKEKMIKYDGWLHKHKKIYTDAIREVDS